MIEQGQAGATRVGDAQTLSGAVRELKELFADAIAERGSLAHEDTVEYLVGYLDPHSSWTVVATEMARSFPGATVRVDEILGDLVRFLDNSAARESLLRCAESALVRARTALAGVQPQLVPAGSRLACALADLENALDLLAQLDGDSTVTVEEGPAGTVVPTPNRYAQNGPP